jgi:hypothetical protein
MNLRIVRLLFVNAAVGAAAFVQIACTTTLGAPEGDDAYEVESATEAMQDEEEEEASKSINR